MNKMLLVTRNEIQTTLGRKAFTIVAIGLPLVLGLVALLVTAINQDAAAAAEEAGPPKVEQVVEGYVDAGGLIEVVPADVPPGRLVEYADEAAAQAALEAEEIAGYYVIAPDYVESGAVTYVELQYNPLAGSLDSSVIQWVVLVNLLGSEELAAGVSAPLNITVTSLAPAGDEIDRNSWIVELLPNLMALILYMVILMPSGLLVTAVTDEKKNRVMEILVSSVSPVQLIGGKIIALGLLGLLQTALWVGVLYGVVYFGGAPLNIPPGFELPRLLLVWAIVYGLLGYAMYGTLMAGLGALVPDIRDARSATLVVMSPLIFVYMFLVTIVTAPSKPLAVALSLFPFTSPVGMIARMTKTAVPQWQVVLAAGLQLLTVVVILRLAARLFRAQHMLSGQPFSTRQYFRTLLGKG